MATKEKKETVIRRKQCEEILKCDLSKDELLAYGEKMADCQDEANQLQAQLDSTKKELTGKIDSLIGQAELIGGKIRAKYEHRAVKCERVEDFTHKRVKLIRLDTHVVEKDRPMTTDEANELPLDSELETIRDEE